MVKNLTFWKFIAAQLSAGGSVMLLIVAESKGSSPGRQGFKMAVSAHDEIIGSIGGGIMEIKLVELAKMKLKDHDVNPFIKKQIHSKDAVRNQSGMICSGEQTILYVKLDNTYKSEVDKIVEAIHNNNPVLLQITSNDNEPDFQIKDLSKDELKYSFTSPCENEFIYQERIGFKDELYIVGGGHCALALSELMSKFDFYIHLIDDREGLNTIESNRFVHEKHIIGDFSEVSSLIPSGENIYIVIMTLGYRTDKIVIRELRDKKVFYMALLGSESKIKTLKEELAGEGLNNDFFNRIHAPAGLRINSHTPEELAVSIAAEIIGVKNNS